MREGVSTRGEEFGGDDEAQPIDEAVRRVREMPDGGESGMLMDRSGSGIKNDLIDVLDTGALSGVGIAMIAGSLGYLNGLWVTVDRGYAEAGIFLDPAFGVLTAGFIAGFGALFLGYNIGWQSDAEADDS